MPIKSLATHGHFQTIEGIFHDIVRIQLVDTLHDLIDIGLLGLGKQEEFDARHGLEAREPEQRALEDLEARQRRAGRGPRR